RETRREERVRCPRLGRVDRRPDAHDLGQRAGFPGEPHVREQWLLTGDKLRPPVRSARPAQAGCARNGECVRFPPVVFQTWLLGLSSRMVQSPHLQTGRRLTRLGQELAWPLTPTMATERGARQSARPCVL